MCATQHITRNSTNAFSQVCLYHVKTLVEGQNRLDSFVDHYYVCDPSEVHPITNSPYLPLKVRNLFCFCPLEEPRLRRMLVIPPRRFVLIDDGGRVTFVHWERQMCRRYVISFDRILCCCFVFRSLCRMIVIHQRILEDLVVVH
jgi:hypothetical protein